MPIAPLNENAAQRKTTASARVGLTIISLFFLAFGILISALVLTTFSKALAQHSWPATDCIITQSHIVDNERPSDPNYRLNVAFTYTVGSQTFTATQFRTDYTGTGDYYDAEKLRDIYPPVSHATAWYDPIHPATAVLQRTSLLVGMFALFPLALVSIGLGGLGFTWFTDRFAGSPKLTRAKRKPGKIFFALFFLAGTSFLIFFFIPLLVRGWHARAWPQVPCTIVHTGISSHSGNRGGTTYSIEVLYRYQFDGKNYASSKYGFMSGGSSDYYGKQDIVRALPPRKKTICYVNPADPAYAVLDRGYGSILLFALIPLAFTLIGAAGLFRSFRPKPAATTTTIPGSMIGDLGAPQRPQTAASALLVAVCFAVFWNGIVSIFVNQLIVEWTHGQHDYFLAVFLVPFVFVGLAFIVYVGYCVMKCF